jgi:arylsulfatase A-like enzyme
MHVHLMGPHAPYYPGIKRAWKSVPVRSYLSILGYAKRREDLPDVLRQHVKYLYDQCIARLDELLSGFLNSFSNDTSIVLTADHGEEFTHGRFGHARLYNETTRCPYLTNDPRLVPSASAIRQVDVAPTILDRFGISLPESWEGQPARYDRTPLQPMQNKGTQRGREWFGIHDETRKIIETFDKEGALLKEEIYQLDEDPEEKNPVKEVSDISEMRQGLSEFKSRFTNVEDGRNDVGLTNDVDQRLRELGYQ